MEDLKRLDQETAERARHNDLYKIVYPEKFKAGQELIGQAVSLHTVLFNSLFSNRGVPEPPQLRMQANRIALMAHTLDWLLGSEIVARSRTYQMACEELIFHIESKQSQQINAAWKEVDKEFSALKGALRQELHIPIFEQSMRETGKDLVRKT